MTWLSSGRRASGQGLNPPKTRLATLQLWSPSPTVCGLQVVQVAESLGIASSNAPAAAACGRLCLMLLLLLRLLK